MGILRAILGLFRGRTSANGGSDWSIYAAQREGRPATILVNLALAEFQRCREFPVWLDTSVALRQFDDYGMPGTEELARLDSLGERLMAAMPSGGAINVGISSCNGRRHWYFYARSADARALASRILDQSGESTPSVVLRDDPEWNMYRTYLLPTPAERRSMEDNMVIAALVQAGDIGERERRINHWAYFPTRPEADRFAAWATGNGFEIEEITEPQDEQPQFGVQFMHTGPAIPVAITEKTAAADQAAANCGGEYDGWETFLVKE